MLEDPWKILLYLVIANVVLSGVHWVLLRFKDKTETKIDDNIDAAVVFLLDMIEWLMAARRRPK